MDTQNQSIKLDIQNWRLRIDERSRNRMKIQIKLSKDEAEAFKNFSSVIKPEEVSDDDFMKTIFVTGCEAPTSVPCMQQRLSREMNGWHHLPSELSSLQQCKVCKRRR